ncbi:MAG: histidine phosphatase family protein [Rubricoccaceae bacterium]|nr:histidine phosphatase family protein [Rubricoccaceae bacterium]
MKTLLLLRHAKSDWDADFETDHERPLSARGRRDAPRMGRFLAANGPLPDLCLTSTAVRARTTLRLAHEAGGWPAPIEETRDLYHANPPSVLRLLEGIDDDVETILLAGHEPTMSSVVEGFTGGQVRMPTAALACIDFEIDEWEDVDWEDGTLRWLVIPKALKKAYGG